MKTIGCLVFAAITLFVLMISGMIYSINEGNSFETYKAWRSLYPQSSITYDEWRRLKQAELLPGTQDRVNMVPVPVVIPIH